MVFPVDISTLPKACRVEYAKLVYALMMYLSPRSIKKVFNLSMKKGS